MLFFIFFIRDGIKVAYQTESRMSKTNFRDIQ